MAVVWWSRALSDSGRDPASRRRLARGRAPRAASTGSRRASPALPDARRRPGSLRARSDATGGHRSRPRARRGSVSRRVGQIATRARVAAKRSGTILKGPLGEALRAVAEALADLPVPGMVIGGMAAIARGVPRLTPSHHPRIRTGHRRAGAAGGVRSDREGGTGPDCVERRPVASGLPREGVPRRPIQSARSPSSHGWHSGPPQSKSVSSASVLLSKQSL